MSVTLVMVADVPSRAVATFQAYEARVLPLLERHGGTLQRRLRDDAGTTEVHVIRFASRNGYEAYLSDPDRVQHRRLLDGVELQQRVVEVVDVDDLGDLGD